MLRYVDRSTSRLHIITSERDKKYIFSDNKFFCIACGRMNAAELPDDYEPITQWSEGEGGTITYVPVERSKIVEITEEAKEAIHEYLILQIAEFGVIPPLQSFISKELNLKRTLIGRGELVQYLVRKFMVDELKNL